MLLDPQPEYIHTGVFSSPEERGRLCDLIRQAQIFEYRGRGADGIDHCIETREERDHQINTCATAHGLPPTRGVYGYNTATGEFLAHPDQLQEAPEE